MSSELPYALDASTPLAPEELAVLRAQYDKERAAGHVTVQSKFNLAWGLVKDGRRERVVEGVSLLGEIYRAEPLRRRECLYYLALGHYKLGNFDDAKRFNDLLLAKEPNNLQAQSLSQLIERGVAKEGYVGLALVGGAAALGGLLIAGLMRGRGRR